MALIMASSKQAFIDSLTERLRALVGKADRDSIGLFCNNFFGIASHAELASRQDHDLLGCTLSAWRFLQKRLQRSLPAPCEELLQTEPRSVSLQCIPQLRDAFKPAVCRVAFVWMGSGGQPTPCLMYSTRRDWVRTVGPP